MKQINLIFKFILSAFSGNLFSVCLILALSLAFRSESVFSQGAISVPREVYEKLPKVNWDTLKKYSPLKTFSPKSILTVKTLLSPPIGDQGTDGSCQSWATGYCALGILSYPKYGCWDEGQRSPSYVYNQIKQGNCEYGASVLDALNLLTSQGSCAWYLMPYIIGNCTTTPTTYQRLEASKNNAFSWGTIDYTSITAIKNSIDLGYPVIVNIHLDQSYWDMWYAGGYWLQKYGTVFGNHTVCIIGYDDTQELFKVQNSLGSINGDHGFFWVQYGLVTSGVFYEGYVLSGMNPNYFETISGPGAVCTSGSSYILNNLPPNTSVSWQSSSNISVVSTGVNTCTAYKTSSGSGYIRALNCGSMVSVTYPVTCDAFSAVPVSGQSGVCPGSLYTYTANVPGGHYPGYGYTWTYPSGWMNNGQNQNQIILQTPRYSMTYGTVRVSVTSCNGSSGYSGITVYPGGGCPHYFTIYPNPASDNITITMIDNSLSNTDTTFVNQNIPNASIPTNFTVKIYNSQSALISSVKRNGLNFSVPLTNMRDGTYIVEVSDGKTSTTQTLIVKHN